MSNIEIEASQEQAQEEPGTGHAQAIGETLLETMPDVNHAAFDGTDQVKKPSKSKKAQGPDIYKRDSQGRMLKNKDGSPKKKAGRRPKESTVYTPPDPIEEQSKLEAEMVQQIAGESAANLTFTLGMLISDDYAPIVDQATGQNEPLVMTKAYADYFKSRGWNDIPPGAALVLTLGNYFGSRLTRPKTQARLGSGWSRFKLWAFDKWSNRSKKKSQDKPEPEKGKESARPEPVKVSEPAHPPATHPDYIQ